MATEAQEAKFLELAAIPGYETLRQECPQIKGYVNGHLHRKRSDDCRLCQGRGWLPLPEAERLGALVRVANIRGLLVMFNREGQVEVWQDTDTTYCLADGGDLTHETALTEALLAAVNGQEG